MTQALLATRTTYGQPVPGPAPGLASQLASGLALGLVRKPAPKAAPASAILARAARVMDATTAEAASRDLFEALRPFGVTLLLLRDRTRAAPHDGGGEAETGAPVPILAGPAVGEDAAFRRAVIEHAPCEGVAGRGQALHRLSDLAPPADPRHAAYWRLLANADVHDGVVVAVEAEPRRAVTVTLGLDRRDPPPELVFALQMCALLLGQRVVWLRPPPRRTEAEPRLTAREKAALRLVAAGKPDDVIADLMGVSRHTARFHVDNGRRKLDASSRAHAVALLTASGEI